MGHHPLSMSNWPKWEQCPCAQSGGPESEEATSGTRSHSWLHSRLLLLNGTDCETPEGVTADERARAEWACGEIGAILGSYRPESEATVTIHGHEELDGICGTADAYAIHSDRIVVFDYKTYSTNACDLMAQPIGYGIAIATSDPFAPTKIEAVILHGGSHEVERLVVPLDQALERAHRIIRTHLAQADNTDVACPCHFCRYCPRLQTCPGADKALALVGDKPRFAALPLAEQLVVAKQVKSICERVERDVKMELDRQIKAGTPVEEAVVAGGKASWHYVLKNGTEKLADIVGLANEVCKVGIDQCALMALCSISKTALCDQIVALNDGMSVAAAKRIIKPFYAAGKPSKWLERVA